MDMFRLQNYKLMSSTRLSDKYHQGALNSEYCTLNRISRHHYSEAPSIVHSIIELSPWSQWIRDQDQLAYKAHHQQWRQLVSKLETTKPMTKTSYDQSRSVQHDINHFQCLQSTTWHRRTRNCTIDRINSLPKSIKLRDQVVYNPCRQHWRRWLWVHDPFYMTIECDH